MRAGIIDPTKVVRSALQNAASVAGLMLATQLFGTSELGIDGHSHGAPGGGMGGIM